jgi:putative nucleotidyltransferase with HDIG domain
MDIHKKLRELEEENLLLGEKLVENFLHTVDVLSLIVEALERFYETSHSRFVANKSAELAEKLQLGPQEVFEVHTAALLHDIGKVALPEVINSKFIPEMSKEQYSLYKQHPELGRQMLLRHDGFERIARIVGEHHERIDGSGFPNNLRGEDIHPGAKIIAVVDTYHNVMFRRSKDRFSIGDSAPARYGANFLRDTEVRYGQIISHLRNKSNVLYNPKVVEAFIDMVEIERKQLGMAQIERVAINNLRPGMVLADSYYTTYGLLIASRGEKISDKMIATMMRLSDSNELPPRILILM